MTKNPFARNCSASNDSRTTPEVLRSRKIVSSTPGKGRPLARRLADDGAVQRVRVASG
jgi:hypothetical protein